MPSLVPARVLRVSFALLVVTACSKDSTSPPTPAALSATTASTLTATVGTALATVPTVKVVDKNGTALSGIAVSFALSNGGGTLGRTSATTDANGLASVGSWTLGTAAGTYTLDATSGALSSVRFTATATAGAATGLATVNSGQTANVGDAVATAPGVTATDQFGNPVAGLAITFAVQSGGGALTGATTTTGADGVARVGSWTLGLATGAQQLRATAGALGVSLLATAVVPTGCTVTKYALGVTFDMAWSADDCTSTQLAGRRYDRLQFSTTAQQQIDATVTGPSGRALLLRNVTTGLYVGLQPGTGFSPAAQNPMHLKYVLPAGTWAFEPHTPSAATTTGSYTFATTTGTSVDCDYIVFGTPGITITDSLSATTSCIGPSPSREQWVNLQLKTGMKVRMTLTGIDFVPILVFRDDRLGPASPTLASKVGNAIGETLVIEWTATFDTWHEIIVATKTGKYGRYTLKIEEIP
jgi:hypothetical protein